MEVNKQSYISQVIIEVYIARPTSSSVEMPIALFVK